MKRWGGVLLKWEPRETTKVLVEICCGATKHADGDSSSSRTNGSDTLDSKEKKRSGGGGGGYEVLDYTTSGSIPSTRVTEASPSRVASPEPAEPLPSPRQFFAHFVDHPREFISFLEQVGSRRYGKSLDSIKVPKNLSGVDDPLPTPRNLGAFEYGDADTRDEQAVWNTLLELYVSPLPAKEGMTGVDEQERAQLQSKAIKVLKSRETVPYDETQALLVCTTKEFVDGFVLIYELLGMYEDIVRCESLLSPCFVNSTDIFHASQIGSTLRPLHLRTPSTPIVLFPLCVAMAPLNLHYIEPSFPTSQRPLPSSRITKPTFSRYSTKSMSVKSCHQSRSSRS